MIDTQTLRTVAQSYDIVFGKPGEPKQTRRGNHVRAAADELDRLYLDTAPLSRADLEGVLREAGLEKTNNKNTSHEWEVRYIQFHEYRGVTIIDEPDGSISISATYDKGIANQLRKVFRMPPTRRLLRDCGVIA